MKREPAARCYLVDVDGEVCSARFTRVPTEEDLSAFREVVRAVRRRLAGPAPVRSEP